MLEGSLHCYNLKMLWQDQSLRLGSIRIALATNPLGEFYVLL